MNRTLAYCLIAIFSIFIGTQITEGCLLVPYWKTLGTTEFYEYYSQWGPIIGRFFTLLTVFAALIPISISTYCFSMKSNALRYALISTFFAILFVVLFYIYFKDTNQKFYDATFNMEQLRSELKIWEYWHWARVLLEFLSLTFLILTFNILTGRGDKSALNEIA